MSTSTKAVFLSYASQDAVAARRIADALRALGVEVWFDQAELRGGDAWDAKIRRQIHECALFVPIISQHTQERSEGYFRREWKLGVERTHDMAEDVAFLVPVVIDDTSDAAARVPEKFREVQWTRLPVGEVPATFAGRVHALIAGEGKAGQCSVSRETARAVARGSTQRAAGFAALGLLLAVVFALGLWQSWQRSATSHMAVAPASNATPTEVERLLAKLWALYEKQHDSSREDWTLADELGAQAVKLEPANPDAWAAYAQATLGAYIYNFDRATARLQAALQRATRAINLAPDSVEAQFALANCYRWTPGTRDEAERLLRALAGRVPEDTRILRTLASALRDQGKFDDALTVVERVITIDPLAVGDKGRILRDKGDLAAAEAAYERWFALCASPRAYVMKILCRVLLHDDLDGARALLDQEPAGFLLREENAVQAAQIWLWRREPENCLKALRTLSDDELQHGAHVDGAPKAFLTGQAHQLAGRAAAAEADWRSALQRIDARLTERTNDANALYWKARLLACLGDKTEATHCLLVFQQLRGRRESSFEAAHVLVLLGENDEALDLLAESIDESRASWAHFERLATLRHDPAFDLLRGTPRYLALLEGSNR